MSIHKIIREKILKFSKNEIDTSLSSLCHLSNSESAVGYFYLKLILRQFKAKYFFSILKYMISIGYQKNFRFISKPIKSYRYIFVTWAFKKNFNKDGSLTDRYFSINSNYKKKDTLWCVIYMDKVLPQKINNNVLIFKTEKKFSFQYLIKNVYELLVQKKFNLKKVFHELFSTSNFAKIFLNEFNNKINLKDTFKIILPYEGQPFQNYLFKYIKHHYKQIKTFGYLHYAHPLQFDIIYREGSPDTLLTHSFDQKKYLIRKLGWPMERVKQIESLRYLNNENNKYYQNKIFLPYYLSESSKYIKEFKNLIENSKKGFFPKLYINPHPSSHNIIRQKKFINKIKKIMIKNKEKFNKKKRDKISVIFGLSTTPLLLLERGINTLHITIDTGLHAFDPKYWPSIHVERITEKILKYSLINKNKCIMIGRDSKKTLKFFYT